MNFFGHVVAASWVSAEPAFGLGSMLPDFASMIGARLRASSHVTTKEGIDWHHTTDAAFHRAVAEGAEALEEPRDMPYGDRRAMVRDRWGNVWQIATHGGRFTL